MLTDMHRTKLDDIVSKMVTNNEPDDAIQFVVDDFKSIYDVPDKPAVEPSNFIRNQREQAQATTEPVQQPVVPQQPQQTPTQRVPSVVEQFAPNINLNTLKESMIRAPRTGERFLEPTPEEQAMSSHAFSQKAARETGPRFETGPVGAALYGVPGSLLEGIVPSEGAEQAQLAQPGAYQAGKVVGTIASSLGGAAEISKQLGKHALFKNPSLLKNAATRFLTSTGVSGVQATGDVIQGKKELGEAILDVAQIGVGSLVSIVPEVVMPAGAVQLLAQPLTDLLYEYTADSIRGKDTNSPEWMKAQVLNMGISWSFALRDVASGETFKIEQGQYRSDVEGSYKKLKGWLKNKKGNKIELVEPKKVDAGQPEVQQAAPEVKPEPIPDQPIDLAQRVQQQPDKGTPIKPVEEAPVAKKPVATPPSSRSKVMRDEPMGFSPGSKSLVEAETKATADKKPSTLELDPSGEVIPKRALKAAEDEDVKFLSTWEDMYSKVKDSTVAIRKVQYLWEKATGKKVSDEDNLEYKIDRVRGSGGIARQFVSDNLSPAIDKIQKVTDIKTGKQKKRSSKEIGIVNRKLDEYLIAKRQQWLYENKKGYDDAAAGYSKEWANDIVSKVESGESKYSESIQGAAKDIWGYSQKLRDVKKDFGIIDEDFHAMLNEPYYVPFKRDFGEKRVVGAGGTEKFTTTSKGIKRIKGSTTGKKIKPIFSNIVEATNETIVNAYRNDVFTSIIKMGGETDEVGGLISKVPPKWIKQGTIEHRAAVDQVLSPKIDGLIEKLGGTKKVKARTGKLLGSFNPGRKDIEVMFGATESTRAHELGHLIDIDVMPLNKLMSKNADEFNQVAEARYEGQEATQKYINYVNKPSEKAAEFVSMYITDRDALKRIAPNSVGEFESMIGGHDALKDLVGMVPSRSRGIEKFEENNMVMDTSIPKDKDVISGFVDGKMQHFKVPIELATAVKNLNPEQIPTLLRIALIPNQLLRKGAVNYNLDFIIPNAVRDQIGASFNAKNVPVVDFFKGIKHYIAQDEVYKQYMRGGGAMDAPESGVASINKSAKELVYGNKNGEFIDPHFWKENGALKGTAKLGKYLVSAPFRGISNLAEASEMATRLGVYGRAKTGAKPAGEGEAIQTARQATLDFQRFGSKGKIPNQIVPFLNAAMEGVDRTVRSAHDDPKRFLMAAFTYGVAPTLAFTAWNKENPTYKDIPNRDKENNYIIMKDKVSRRHWKIPKSHVVKLIVNPFQMAWEESLGTGKGGWKDLASQTFGNASPIDNVGGLMPVTLKMLTEPMADYDFYWRQRIEGDVLKRINEPGERHKTSTSETLKTIGKALHISPVIMEHELKTVFSGAGKHTLLALDWALGATGIQAKPTIPIEKIPVLRRFIGKAEEWKSEASKDIREIDKTVRELEKLSINTLVEYKGYTKEKAKELKRENMKAIKKLLAKKTELENANSGINRLIEKSTNIIGGL